MHTIIEAGSSKTDVALLKKNGEGILKMQFDGLNPSTDPEFEKKLRDICKSLIHFGISECYYYGSGVTGPKTKALVQNTIKKCWADMSAYVFDDLLGAARSIHGSNASFIGILGTGSNFGYYDGQRITKKIASCGYLLGDEGSGFRIGQAIYLQFARAQFEEGLMKLISSKYNVSAHQAISRLYDEPNHRTYLASFSKIIHELPIEIQNEILNEVFDNFINKMVKPLSQETQLPVSLVGSIAFRFQDILKEKFEKSNIIAGSFVKSPIEGLIKYHEHGQNN